MAYPPPVPSPVTPSMTAEHALRWDSWQQANSASALRSDYVARMFGLSMLALGLTNLAISIWS